MGWWRFWFGSGDRALRRTAEAWAQSVGAGRNG
jgi:hypothetical protein